MKVALVSILALAGIGLGLYSAYFFIIPNVTVINSSGHALSSVVVTLPGSRLDFGGLTAGDANTIYYSITQADGE